MNIPGSAVPATEAPLTAVRSPGFTRAQAAFFLLHASTWLALLVQLVLDRSYDNIVCAVFVGLSASLTFGYLRATRAFREVPLSSMALLGLCMTTQWGALIGQSLLLDSLTVNLRVPLQTFGYLLGFQAVATAAHWVSRRLSLFTGFRRVTAQAVLQPLGLFRVPTVQAVWFIGAVGLGAVLLSRALENNLLGKVGEGFSLFAWAPFVIPLLAARHGPAYCNLRVQLPAVAVFAAAMMAIGLATNARAFMLLGVLTAVLLFGLYVLDDERPLRWRHVRLLLVVVLAGLVVAQPLGYFFTAMQVARAERDKLTRWQMVQHTLDVLQDPAAIQRENTRVELDAQSGAYDEYYFRSAMLGRLVETKFHDNSFYMVDGVNAVESRMVAEDVRDRLIAILPYPLLKSMGLERAKYVNLYSAGDLLVNMRLGLDLGGFRTGSMFAQGLAIFGVWTPFLYFLLCIPMFLVWDLLSRPGRSGAAAVVSVVGMLLTYRLFAYGIVAESIGTLAGVLLRVQLQNVVFYALLFGFTRLWWKPFDPAPGQPP